MADKKNFTDAYVSGRKEVTLNYNGEEVKFFVEELGFLASQHIAVKASVEGKNGLALLVCETVVDESGNRFTYDEVLRMKKQFVKPLFDMVMELHGAGEEKN